jgi:hypothetical protein
MGIIVWIAVGLATEFRAGCRQPAIAGRRQRDGRYKRPGLMLPAVALHVAADQMPGRRSLRSVIHSTGRRQVGHRTALP